MSRIRGSRIVRVGRCGLSAFDGAHTILTITSDGGGGVIVTTAAPHGLTGSEAVTISGNSNSAYNQSGQSLAGSPPTPTTFQLAGLVYDVDGTGGRWSLG